MASMIITFLLPAIGATTTTDTVNEDARKRLHQLNDGGYTQDDVQAEIDFGKKLAAGILGKTTILANKKMNSYVNTIGSLLVSQVGRPELRYHFAILDSDDVNAYACPGGYIFVSKGALKLMKNEGQLAGVLAHEITHVNQRHIVKQLNIKAKDDSLNSNIAAVVGGGSTAFFTMLNQGMDLLFTDGLKREDEYEADAIGLEMLTALGYNVRSYYDFLEEVKRSNEQHKDQVMNKTHPSMDSRLERIKLIMTQNGLHQLNGNTNQPRFSKYVTL